MTRFMGDSAALKGRGRGAWGAGDMSGASGLRGIYVVVCTAPVCRRGARSHVALCNCGKYPANGVAGPVFLWDP